MDCFEKNVVIICIGDLLKTSTQKFIHGEIKFSSYHEKTICSMEVLKAGVFSCSNRADRKKDKSNYRFPSFVKNNGKEGLKLSKVRREKWLAQIFRKVLTEKKLERTRMKIILSASPSSIFFTQSLQYQI